jgi:DNA-binding transcriptional MerR regulator/methylmalonyl-CoA mutase cobalamin-binding subunit
MMQLSIGAVARQTGIQIATLRKWEVRYGFPVPLRTAGGQRSYQQQDVEALLEIRRRQLAGERISKLLVANREAAVETSRNDQPAVMTPDLVGQALDALKKNDLKLFRQRVEGARRAVRAEEFIERLAAPLTGAVGEAWLSGELPVFAEHYFSRFLREQLGCYSRSAAADNCQPMVLLASPSGEHHTLGLAMLEAALQEQGVETAMLEGDLPIGELVSAAVVYGVRVVALSASLSFSPKILGAMVAQLRRDLPAHISIWLGGTGSQKLCTLPSGVQGMSSIQEAIAASKLMLGECAPAGIQE